MFTKSRQLISLWIHSKNVPRYLCSLRNKYFCEMRCTNACEILKYWRLRPNHVFAPQSTLSGTSTASDRFAQTCQLFLQLVNIKYKIKSHLIKHGRTHGVKKFFSNFRLIHPIHSFKIFTHIYVIHTYWTNHWKYILKLYKNFKMPCDNEDKEEFRLAIEAYFWLNRYTRINHTAFVSNKT